MSRIEGINKRIAKYRLSSNPKKNILARRKRMEPQHENACTVKSRFYRRNVTYKIMANKYCLVSA